MRNAAYAAAWIFVWLFAATTPSPVTAAEISFEIMADKDAPGNDFKRFKGVSLEVCQARCGEESQCAAFTYNHRRKFCFLKDRTDPELSDYSGATTGLKQIKDTAPAPSEPGTAPAPAAQDGVAPAPPDRADEPAIQTEPEIETARATDGCTLFDGDFALTRDPAITLKFEQPAGDGADKARMAFYNQGDKVLSGRLTVEAGRFRFVEDGEGTVSRGVTILDRTHPSGNTISDPAFVVVGGLPFKGGVFRRAPCRAP